MSGRDLVKALGAFVGLITEVSKSIDDQLPVQSWGVSVREGSQIFEVFPNDAEIPSRLGYDVASAVLDVLDAIEDASESPYVDNDRVVAHIETLSSMAIRDKMPIPVSIVSKHQAKSLTRNIHNNAKQILSWDNEDSGTVDGILNVVSAHSGYEFKISDFLTNKVVKCIVAEPMLEQAIACFRKRVEVSGLIGYTKQGFPRLVKAETIVPYPEAGEIPHYSELRGILRDK